MKRILCYGDSNTWGRVPGDESVRYPEDVRWTGRLQSLLGPDCRVEEAGLNGRTTILDDPYNGTLNGLKGLAMTLCSAAPLDLVVLMLGTNDLKYQDAWPTTMGVHTLVTEIFRYRECFRGERPNVLLVSPIQIAERYTVLLGEPGARPLAEESRKLAGFYQAFARALKVPFFDAASVAEPSDVDGVHLDADGHARLAQALAPVVRSLLDGGC